jgi:hypothetical protein
MLLSVIKGCAAAALAKCKDFNKMAVKLLDRCSAIEKKHGTRKQQTFSNAHACSTNRRFGNGVPVFTAYPYFHES